MSSVSPVKFSHAPLHAMNFGQRQQWPSPPALSSSGLSLPSAYSLPLPRSRTPSHRLQKTPFPSSRTPHPSFQPLQPLTSPNSTPGSVSNSKSGSTSPVSSKDTNPSATLKRNSGGSSGSSSGGGINTTDWRSTTNVYIKGLPEKCTNSDLQLWAEQVANPVSVKTIRDARDHNICTGLGFVRFSLPAQAKLFIALVNAVEGYEACLAKETYVGKMEKASDPRSANLYLSHIPLNYSEQDVLSLFPSPTYVVRSLRLLHEGDQPGQRAPPGTPFKGAGFIRLDTREMAERAISELNGKRLPGHGRRPGRSTLPNGELHTYYDTLQVRFADTDVQKQIKLTETEEEQRHALEASGQIPPRSRKGQAYRRLSFSTEQKIKNSARRGRRGSGATGGGIAGGLYTPPHLFGSSPSTAPSMMHLPPPTRGFLPSSSASFGLSSSGLSAPFRPITPGISRNISQPYAPPNSPVSDLLRSPSYASDTPPSLEGFTSSIYSGSPGSFGSFSPNPSFMPPFPRSVTPFDPHTGSLLPPHPTSTSNLGLGLSLEPTMQLPGSLGGYQPYTDDVSQGMKALQAQQERIHRSIENIDRMSARRGSAASYSSASFEGMTSLLGKTSLNSYSPSPYFNEDGYATYDLAKLGVAPPATPPPESSHPYFDTPLDSRRPSSRNNHHSHQRAHTTALTALPATPSSHDPDYSPSKLLAPASALARRSSAVEARIARRRASQMSLNSSSNSSHALHDSMRSHL